MLSGDGATVLGSATASPLGSAETIADLALANPGVYFVRVSGSAANSAQLYSLSLTSQPLSSPVLSLTGQVSPPLGSHPVGSELAYLLTVSNSGSGAASAVVVRACLDSRFDPLQVTALDAGLLNQPPAPAGCAGDWITWSLGSPIAADSSVAVGFRAVIPLATADGATLSNSAEVVSSQTSAAFSGAISASACAPGLVLATAASSSAYAEGDTVTWTLTASNPHAGCSSTEISLTDDIDLALVEDQPTLTWSTPSGASSAWSGGRLTWTLPTLAPGATTVITISSRIRAGTGGSMLCNQGGGAWAQGAAPASSSAACSEIAAGCPVSGVPAAAGLLLRKGPGAGELTASWSALTLAQEYDLWRIALDKTAVPSAGRAGAPAVSAVAGCAHPTPATGTSCVDLGARAAEGVDFYQVRGVCGGAEGAL